MQLVAGEQQVVEQHASHCLALRTQAEGDLVHVLPEVHVAEVAIAQLNTADVVEVGMDHG